MALDPSLLEPPEAEPFPGRAAVASLVGGLVLIVGLLVWSPWSDPGVNTPAGGAPSTAATDGGEEDGTAHLVAVSYPEDFLLYPRLLPAGFRHCWVADDLRDTDRFCDPDSEDRWVNLAIDTSAQLGAGTPVPGLPRAEWAQLGRRVLIPMGGATLSITASGLTPEEILSVADSVPAVGDRNAMAVSLEEPVRLESVTDDQLVGLLGRFGEDGSVRRDAVWFSASADDIVFMGSPRYDELYAFAATMVKPRLITVEGRLVVLGESDTRSRWWAAWIQRGYVFQAEGRGTLQDGVATATRAIPAIAALP